MVEEIPALFDPEGSGALQLYAFQSKTGKFDASEELTNYLKIHEIDYDEDKVAHFENNEGTSIRACEFFRDSRIWLVYLMANQGKMLLATYNSCEPVEDELFQTLTHIISSVRFL